jgi:hypothetical protein
MAWYRLIVPLASGHSARFFVAVWANWLAVPAQIGPHRHVVLRLELLKLIAQLHKYVWFFFEFNKWF